MSNPAIEAMQRALTADGWPSNHDSLALAAAREALEPLRELHRAMPTDQGLVCDGCFDLLADPIFWPCENAKHLYSSEELS